MISIRYKLHPQVLKLLDLVVKFQCTIVIGHSNITNCRHRHGLVVGIF